MAINPSDRISSISDSDVLVFARRAQKNKQQNFTGWEIKAKNVPHFRDAIRTLYLHNDASATNFVNAFAPMVSENDDSEDNPLVGDSIEPLLKRIEASRERLTEAMQLVVTEVQVQTASQAAMQLRLDTLEASSETPHNLPFGAAAYVNELSMVKRELLLLKALINQPKPSGSATW